LDGSGGLTPTGGDTDALALNTPPVLSLLAARASISCYTPILFLFFVVVLLGFGFKNIESSCEFVWWFVCARPLCLARKKKMMKGWGPITP
jgi:hypothetical protein